MGIPIRAFGPFTASVALAFVVLTGLWYYEELQLLMQQREPMSERKATDTATVPPPPPSPQPVHCTPPSSQDSTCPTNNIDVFIVTEKKSFALVEWTIRSIQLFMPCRGTLHIVCDPGETALLLAHVGVVPDVKIYEMERPRKVFGRCISV